MLKNNLKLNISKNFLFCICIICLMFASLGLIEDSFAVDLDNDTVDMELTSDIPDNTINSQNNKHLEVNFQEQVNLGVERGVNGNTFKDIQKAVDAANNEDTIKLNGIYFANEENACITVNKKLNIIGSDTAVLDGQNKSCMFYLKESSAGTTIKNIKFINGNHDVGSAVRIQAKDILVEKCTFEKNYCNVRGAVSTTYDLSTAEHCIIKNCTFKQNFASDFGGFEGEPSGPAASLYGINSEIIDCVFDSNSAIGKKGAYGGAIQVGMDLPGSNAKVTNCVFYNNSAISLNGKSHGGAGCVRDGTSYSNCIFINNLAGQGGALTFHASGSIVNCTFIENKAINYGGALSTGYDYIYMELNVIDCNFDGNTAPEGGAIQVNGINVNIKDSNFKNNNVTRYGGAVKIEAEDVLLDNSIFNSNTAYVDGGAVYIKGKNTLIKDSSFISNNAIPNVTHYNDGLGGAIYVDSSQARINNNYFMYNTARNGSAIYYGASGEKLTLINNTLYQNQAWSYRLPIMVKDIYYGDCEEVKVILYGGNNIADFDNLAVSNAIYNSVSNNKIVIDDEFPMEGARDTGELYQDDREYNINVLLTIQHEDGTLIYNELDHTNHLGEIIVDLENLKPGRYFVSAKHYEDTYYKEIMNVSTFIVKPKVDNKIIKTVDNNHPNFDDVIIWTLNITNQGPNNSTGIIINDVLPEGVIWLSDNSEGKYNPKTGVLNIDVLNVNETITYNIVTLVKKTGVFINKVNITSNELDINTTNNYDEEMIMIIPATDLAVTKHVSDISPNYLSEFNWTIEVTNNGPDIAYNVTVKDLLPDSLIFISSDGNYDNNKGIWDIGTLKNDETVKLNIQCRVKNTGLIQNNVSVNGSEFDYDLTNNNDFEIIYVDPACDLAIEKSVNCSRVNYLDIVRWTLVITNNGPNQANNVKVEDILPDAFTYINSTLTKGYYSDGIFFIESIDVGESVSIEIITQVEETGKFINIAHVTADEYDYNLTNNENNESILVDPAVDLSVTKSVDDSNPKYHEIIGWTITISNNGPDIAHNIIVRDLLPSSLIWIEDTSLGAYDSKTGILTIDSLDVDESFVFNIQCLVNSTGVLNNAVYVNCSEYDYNLINNHDECIIDVEKSADVFIIKLVNESTPKYNELIKWTLIISNNGPDNATDVYVEDLLPKGLIFVNYTATKGFYFDGVWKMCCLNNGEFETLEIITQVNKTGEIINSANVIADEYDSNITNNIDNKSINTPLAVDVEVIINVNNINPLFGEKVVWLITVKNNGPNNATGVILHDMLPKELIFKDYKISKGVYSNENWIIGNLNVGEIEYLNITTLPSSLGNIMNEVNVTSEEYDWNKTNNYDNALIDVKPVTDLSINKLVDNPKPKYGDYLKWTLVAFNNGPNKATNVVVNEILPYGLTFIKANGKYDGINWDIGNLNPGEYKKLEILCKIESTGKLINKVKITGDEYDSNLINNYFEKSIDINPASDLSITKLASKYDYLIGDVIEYIIEVVNNGPDTAKNIKINEILDESLKLKSFKVTNGKFNKFSHVWSIKSLGFGESAILSIKAIATGIGVVKNKVSVFSDAFDYDLSNNHDFAIVNISKIANNHSEDIQKVTNNVNKRMCNGSSDISQKSDYNFTKKSGSILEKHVAGSPFWILILSLVFSLIFLKDNKSNLR